MSGSIGRLQDFSGLTLLLACNTISLTSKELERLQKDAHGSSTLLQRQCPLISIIASEEFLRSQNWYGLTLQTLRFAFIALAVGMGPIRWEMDAFPLRRS